MKSDPFLHAIFQRSPLSESTCSTYKTWISRCCTWCDRKHIADLTPEDISRFLKHLSREREFSASSSTIVYAALKHLYAVLFPAYEGGLSDEECQRFLQALGDPPKQSRALPGIASREMMTRFLEHLPTTNAGNMLRAIYTTGKRLEDIHCGDVTIAFSRHYLESVCAQCARKAGIPHGFGLRGLRATGLVQRIRQCTSEADLRGVFKDSGVSSQQFRKYLQIADGDRHTLSG